MDPLTALLRVIEMVMEIHKLNVESMSGADRLAYGHMVIEDMQRWRDMLKPFIDLFQPKQDTARQIAVAVRDEMQKRRMK